MTLASVKSIPVSSIIKSSSTVVDFASVVSQFGVIAERNFFNHPVLELPALRLVKPKNCIGYSITVEKSLPLTFWHCF